MIVKELIELLHTFDPDLPVAYSIYSEHCLLDEDDVGILNLCRPRPDGWVANARPDKVTQPYLVFP